MRDFSGGVTTSGDQTTSISQVDNSQPGGSFVAVPKEQNDDDDDDDEHERGEGEDVFEWVDVMAYESRLQAEKVQMLFSVFAAMLVHSPHTCPALPARPSLLWSHLIRQVAGRFIWLGKAHEIFIPAL